MSRPWARHPPAIGLDGGITGGGELGYATAWLEYQLRGNVTAAAAFTGAHPELVSIPTGPAAPPSDPHPPQSRPIVGSSVCPSLRLKTIYPNERWFHLSDSAGCPTDGLY